MMTCLPADSPATDLRSPTNQIIHGSTFPADLREWVGASELICFVLEAVQAVYWVEPDESGPGMKHSHPQLMLGLLTYAYATGLQATDEIARLANEDEALGYLCLNARFSPRQLRLFRNQNRELLNHCLSRVLRRAWEVESGDCFQPVTDMSFDQKLRKHFHTEADAAIQRALQADSATITTAPDSVSIMKNATIRD